MFKNYQINRKIVLLFLVALTLFVSFFAYQDRIENRNIIQTEPVAMKNGWTVSYDDTILHNQSLPERIKIKPKTLVTLSNTLPAVSTQFDAILIRSSMQDVVVYVDNELIYTYHNVNNGVFDSPYISTWLLVRLPQDFQGKTLQISVSSPIKDFAGALNLVKIGTPDALIMSVLSSQNISIIIFLILFVSGLILIIMSLFMRDIRGNRLIYLGLFAIAVSVWIISESRILPFLIGNRFVIGGISYLMIFLMCASLALYIKEAILSREKHKSYMQILSGIYFTGLILMVIFQAYGISTYLESTTYALAFVGISIVFTAHLFYIEYRYDHNQNVLPMVKYSLVLVLSILIETIIFYFSLFDFTSHIFRIGILVFFILLIYDTLKAFERNLILHQQQILLEALAFQDTLIHGNNRTRFEQDVQVLTFTEKDYRLIIIDMNNLKKINDHLGHASGDQALQQVYYTLDKVFTGYGKAYRIGGDEFAVISENLDESVYQEKSRQLFEKINHHELPYTISLAIGSDTYHPGQWRQFSEFYHHVDQLMYQHKRKIKEGI